MKLLSRTDIRIAFLLILLVAILGIWLAPGGLSAAPQSPNIIKYHSLYVAHTLNVDGSTTLSGTTEQVGAATFDSDVSVAGATTLTGAATTSAGLTVGTLFGLTPSTLNITVTQDSYITPTNSYQNLTAAGAVSTSRIAAAAAGTVQCFLNTGAQNIVISDTGTLKLSGNLTLTGDDTLCLLSNGTNWYQLTSVIAN